MAKRGSTRSWRVRFEWENGVKGTETFSSEDEVEGFVRRLREYETVGPSTLKSVETQNRLTDTTWSTA